MDLSRHTFSYGTSVRFSCNEGFVLHGSAESRCVADGTWQPALPKCQPGGSSPALCSWQSTVSSCYTIILCICLLVKCRAPTSKENLQFFPVKGEYEFKESLYFSCKLNNNAADRALTTCSTNGSWMPPPNCVSTAALPGFAFYPIYSLEGAGAAMGLHGGGAQHTGPHGIDSCPLSLSWLF